MAVLHVGAPSTTRLITGGSAHTVMNNDGVIGWNSPVALAKTETLGQGVFPGQEVEIKDVYGNAGTYNITISASGCTIDNAANYVINGNLGSVRFKWDGSSNWSILASYSGSNGVFNTNDRFIGRNNAYGMTMNGNKSSASVDQQTTTRMQFTTIGQISRMALIVGNNGTVGPGETAAPNSILQEATVEYPPGTDYSQFSLNGNTTWVLSTNTSLARTDPIGVLIPAATNFDIRFHTRVIIPPTSLSAATSAATGNLTASTTYFYKVTAVEKGVESGPSNEASQATGSATAVQLSWTAPISTPDSYNIYRSTTTGAEVLIANVAGNSTGWLDTNLNTVTSAATPPAAQQFQQTRRIISTDSINNVGTADATASTGALTNLGPSGNRGTQPIAVIGDDLTNNAVIGLGDSIMGGYGINEVVSTVQTYQIGNWFDQGIIATPRNSLNLAIPSARAMYLVDGASASNTVRQRLALLGVGQIVVNALGTNDLENTRTWQQVATDNLTIASSVRNRGGSCYLVTFTPQTTSTDQWTTVANQTVTFAEAARQNYNTWVRLGATVDSSGAPVLTGGTRSPLISGYFDAAAQIEVDIRNILTLNGSYWQTFPTAPFTASGSPSTTSIPTSGSPFTANAVDTWAVTITSGASAGQIAVVNTNTAGTLTLFANGVARQWGIGTWLGLAGAPSAGDTYNLQQTSTPDGTHPSYSTSTTIGVAFAAWLKRIPSYG